MSERVTISATDGTDSAEQGYDLTVLPALGSEVVIRASDGEQSTNQTFSITVLPPVTEPEPPVYQNDRVLTRIDVYRPGGYAEASADEIRVDGDNDLLPYLASLPEVREERSQPHRLSLSVIAPSAWNASRLLRARTRLTTRYSDGTYRSWRITRLRAPADGSGDMEVTAEPLWLDLADSTFRYYRTDNTSRSRALRNITFQRAIETALAAENGRPSIIRLGGIESAIADRLVNLEANLTSHLDLIRDLCAQAECEYETREEGGLVYLDFVRQVGWSAEEHAAGQPLPSLRPIEGPSRLGASNRRSLIEDADAADYFSRVIPVVTAGGEPQTIRSLWWKVIEGGSGSFKLEADLPIWRNGVYNGFAAVFEDGLYARITGCQTDGSITITGSKTVTAGAYVKLAQIIEGPGTGAVADHTIVDLDYLHDPDLEAASGTSERHHELVDAAPFENLFEQIGDPAISAALTGWQAFGGAFTQAAQSDLYTFHGTHSLRVTGHSGAGVRTLTMTLPQGARRRSPYVSAWLSIRALAGAATMRIVDVTGGGRTVYPPANDSQIYISGGDEADLAAAVAGVEMDGSEFVVEVELVEDGSEIIIDAVTATQSAGAWEYVPHMGPRAMFAQGLRYLQEQGGFRPSRFDAEVFDVSQYASGIDGDEIRAGSWVTLRDFYDREGQYQLEDTARVESVRYLEDPRQGRIEKTVSLSGRRSTFLDYLRTPPVRPRSPLVPLRAGDMIVLPRPHFSVSAHIVGDGAAYALHASRDDVTDRIHYEIYIDDALQATGTVDFGGATPPVDWPPQMLGLGGDGSVGLLSEPMADPDPPTLEFGPAPSEPLVFQPSGAAVDPPDPPDPPPPVETDPPPSWQPEWPTPPGAIEPSERPTNYVGTDYIRIILTPQRLIKPGDQVRIVAWGEDTDEDRVQDPKWTLELVGLEDYLIRLRDEVESRATLDYVDQWGNAIGGAYPGLTAWAEGTVDALNDRIVELSAGFDLSSLIDWIDQETGDLRDAYAGVSGRVEYIEGELPAIYSELESKASITYVDGETGTLASAISTLQQQVGAIGDGDVSEIWSELALKASIEDVDQEVGTVTSVTSGLSSRVDAVEGTVGDLDDDVSQALTDLLGLEGDVSDLAGDVTALSAALNAKADITYVDDETGALTSAVAGIQAQVDSIEGVVDGDFSALWAELESKAAITYVDDEVGAATSAIAGVTANVSTLQGDLSGLEDDVSALSSSLSLYATIARVEDVEGDVDDLAGLLGDLDDYVSQIDLRVDDTEAAIDASVQWEESSGSYTLRAGPDGSIFTVSADQIDLDGIVQHLEAVGISADWIAAGTLSVDHLDVQGVIDYLEVSNLHLTGAFTSYGGGPTGWVSRLENGTFTSAYLQSARQATMDHSSIRLSSLGGGQDFIVLSRGSNHGQIIVRSTLPTASTVITSTDVVIDGISMMDEVDANVALWEDFHDHIQHRTDAQNDDRYDARYPRVHEVSSSTTPSVGLGKVGDIAFHNGGVNVWFKRRNPDGSSQWTRIDR